MLKWIFLFNLFTWCKIHCNHWQTKHLSWSNKYKDSLLTFLWLTPVYFSPVGPQPRGTRPLRLNVLLAHRFMDLTTKWPGQHSLMWPITFHVYGNFQVCFFHVNLFLSKFLCVSVWGVEWGSASLCGDGDAGGQIQLSTAPFWLVGYMKLRYICRIRN